MPQEACRQPVSTEQRTTQHNTRHAATAPSYRNEVNHGVF